MPDSDTPAAGASAGSAERPVPVPDEARPASGERAPRTWRVVALYVLGLALIQAAWTLTVPPFRGLDEIDHSFRAASVADGHVAGDWRRVEAKRGPIDLIPVPAHLARAARSACEALPYNGAVNCVPTARLGAGEVLIGCSAARYNPFFYVATGYAAKPFHGYGALYAMRICGAALSALLLGLAAWVTARHSRGRWPLVALLVGVTPTFLYSTAVSAPNGLHMASGATLWVALLALYRKRGHDSPRAQRQLLAVAATSAVVLVMTHTLGVLWLGLTVLTMLVLTGWPRVMTLFRRTPAAHVAATLATSAGVLVAAAWVLTARTNDPSTEPVRFAHMPISQPFLGLVLWPLQAVAVFPSRDEPAGLAVYGISLALIAVLGVQALRAVSPRVRAAAALIVVLSAAVPVVLTVATYARLGIAWQGRYGLPFAVGLFLLLGWAVDASPAWSRGARYVAPIVGLLVVSNLLGMHGVVERLHRVPVWRDDPHWLAPSLLVLLALSTPAALAWMRAATSVGVEPRDA